MFAGTKNVLTELLQNNETHLACSNALSASSEVNLTPDGE
jgi:hypothetical protein